MASKRSSKAKRASESSTAELHAEIARKSDHSSAPRDDDASGTVAQRKAIEQAMARQNVRLGGAPGAIGPMSRTVLLIALLALVGLLAAWLFLAI